MAKAKETSDIGSIMADLLSETDNKLSSIVSNGTIGDISTYLDTGCYLLNGQISGSIFKGLPNSQVLQLAGPSGAGKCACGSEKIQYFTAKNGVMLERKISTYKEFFTKYGYDESVPNMTLLDPIAEVYVETVIGKLVPVQKLIRKNKMPVCRIITENGRTFECSIEHLFQNTDGKSVFAKDAKTISTIYGNEKVTEYKEIGEEETYDIQIEDPHWYVSPNGIIHHNTYFGISLLETFIKADEKNIAVIFDSENAINRSRLENKGIDLGRIMYIPVVSLPDFKFQCVKMLDSINNDKKYDGYHFLFILDSIGNLPSAKELADSVIKDKNAVDFTRAKTIRSIFRIISVKLSVKGINLIFTNHSYANIGQMYTSQVASGGGGATFVSDYILMLSKAKHKEGTVVAGGIITSTCQKNRDVKPETKIKMLLHFKKGLHKYYGLLPYAIEAGIVTKVGTRYEFNGTKYWEKQLYGKMCKEVFSQENLEKIDELIQKEFAYGNNLPEDDIDSLIEEESEEVMDEKDE